MASTTDDNDTKDETTATTTRSLSASHHDTKIVNDDDGIPPLRFLGDERLMQVQPPVALEEIQSMEFQQNLQMLPLAMKKYGGIGIAAPQVGWWKRVFCFGIDGTNPRYPNATSIPLTIWINPTLKTTATTTNETNWMWEGCLSVPGMRGWIERPIECILEGLDENGNPREPQHLSGLSARIAQHEYDHLDGKLFPSRVSDPIFLLPQQSMNARDGWANNWPSKGSYSTLLGELSNEK